MQMRKLFAGVAALATLLGGLALGASTANAVDTPASGGVLVQDNATFKFTADDADQWKNREVKYYKLADYVRYGTAPDAKYGVQTATTANKEAIKTALEAAVKGSQLTVPTDNTDLMAWALQNGALDSESKPWTGSTRLFANSLAADTKVTGDTSNFKAITFGTDQTGTDRTVSLPAGVYLFVDVIESNGNPAAGEGENANNGNISNGTEQNPTTPNDEVGGKVVTQSAPIVLASGTVTNDTITDPINGDNAVAFKNHVTPVVKSYDDKDGTVSVGQTVNYTLKTTLPAFTTGFENYTFTLTDTPGLGQTVDLSKNLTVKVDGKDFTDYTLSFTGLGDEEQKEKKFDGNGSKSFTFDFSNYLANHQYDEGFKGEVVVTYQVTINKDAKTNHAVLNSVEVNDNKSKAEDKTKLTLGKFSFTKKAADGTLLKGAEFTISAKGNDGAVAPSEDYAITSNDQGVVTFDGLADGVYEVTETKVPEGFLGHTADGQTPSVGAKFEVTIKGNKAVKFVGTDLFGLAKNSADNTESGDEIKDYSVINVRNVTELPKTGAAGIAMFGVIAALLAGASVTVYMKSRATKRALRA